MNGFALSYRSFDPAEEGLREALTSTGNGYLCTRGAAEWEDADGVHYPGTYVHGVYNRETTILGGCRCSTRTWSTAQLAGAQAADRGRGRDPAGRRRPARLPPRARLHRALVTASFASVIAAGRETTLRSRRFVSMADPHHAGIEWTLTPENWSGRVEVVGDRRTRD
jgi:trehalose/maltose hydrolase-like predicted phosphorylase